MAPALIEELASRLNALPGVRIAPELLNKFPSFEMAVLKEQEPMNRFFQAISSFMEQVKADEKANPAKAALK